MALGVLDDGLFTFTLIVVVLRKRVRQVWNEEVQQASTMLRCETAAIAAAAVVEAARQRGMHA
jgi:hypothetical protein